MNIDIEEKLYYIELNANSKNRENIDGPLMGMYDDILMPMHVYAEVKRNVGRPVTLFTGTLDECLERKHFLDDMDISYDIVEI